MCSHVCTLDKVDHRDQEEEDESEDEIIRMMRTYLDKNPPEADRLRGMGTIERKAWLLAEKWVDASRRGELPRRLQRAYMKERAVLDDVHWNV